MKAPKSITVMKYLGIDGDYHFEIVDDLQFPNLEDRMNYLARLERRLWADGEIAEHLWTKTLDNHNGVLDESIDISHSTSW